jgi:hypothetical protein
MPEVPEAVMKDLTESHARLADLWKVTEGNKIIAPDRQNCEEDLTPAELLELKERTAEAIGTAYAVPAAVAAAAATTPPASTLQALKTQADRRGLQIRYEDERLSEQEWRARIVLTTSAGHDMEIPWSSVCLGLKRAKQAAAELAMDYLDCLRHSRTTPQEEAAAAAAAEEEIMRIASLRCD